MAIVKMQKLSIVASKKHRKAILEALQKTGAMEMRVDSIDDPELIHMDTDGARTQFEKTADSFDKALAALNEASPQKDPSGGLFGEKDQVSQADFDRVIGNRENLVADANDILKLVRERAECEGTIAKDRNQIAGLSPWMNLGIPMNSTGTGRTTIFIGTIPEALDEAGLYAAASMGLTDPAPVTGEILSSSPEGTYITVVALNSVADTVSQNLRNIGFSRPATASSYVPKDAAEILEGDIKDQEDRILLIGTEISDFADRREDFRIVSDYFRTRAEKYRLLGKIPQTEHAFFIEGWVTAACAPKITKLLTEKFDAYVENEDKREDEVEPTVLKNNPFSRNMEGVLESYGLPQHGRVDPTFIMSFFYVWFFGMMLSDAGYGIVMAIGCAIILVKHKRLAEGTKKFLTMFFWCGLSTTFWGFMYGGFFGDAIDVVAKTFFGYTGDGILKPLWFDPMGNPMRLLIFCMLFGCIHLFTGLGIKGYEYLRDKDIVGFFCDIVAWYAFLLGLILMLLPSELFQGISGMTFNFSPAMKQVSKWMTIIGMLVILVMSARGKKNWGLRIALGAYDIYGVTSWLSDVLSYSRLLALGLATGVIASVVNMMASMFGGGVVGAILFIIIFIFGHILNLAINALGAYVHTNRLQYVEFFGKFYDGGGIAFKPFTTANKYTEIKEDM